MHCFDCNRPLQGNDDAGICVSCGGCNLLVHQNRRARLACWWFGCQPDYEALRHDSECVPCERCGAMDTTYADRVGDTRHNRLLDRWHRFTWWLVRRHLPRRCPACGARWGCKADCDGIPF